MKTSIVAALAIMAPVSSVLAQTLTWEGKEFELSHVNASNVTLKEEKVLRVERELKSLPFDAKNLAKTVDEPNYVKLKGQANDVES